LDNTKTIAQVDEGNTTVVASSMDPSRQRDFSIDVFGSQFATSMGFVHFAPPFAVFVLITLLQAGSNRTKAGPPWKSSSDLNLRI
jgi:hypothetical protein